MNIQKIAADHINPTVYNPRKDLKPDDPEYQKLLRSIDEFGYIEPLVWNKQTGNLVGGHQRLKILLAKGFKETEVSVVDLSIEKEKALNIALNKISGDWDQDKLAELLDDLCKVPDFDVEITGFVNTNIENLLARLLPDELEGDDYNIDEELTTEKEAITKHGDIIEFGKHNQHRLICGDVTKSDDVAKLLGDMKCQCCNTDPPYGVSYDRRNRPTSKEQRADIDPDEARSMKLQNDDLTPDKYRSWFGKVVEALNMALDPGSSYYIWNSHKNFGLMHDLLTDKNFNISCVLTWAKESFSPNFSDYNQQTEFCMYGWKGGATHNWYGPKNESTLWRINRDRTLLYHHPTQKALELTQRAIRNSSKQGDIIFDPFLGSGTTLIAAARLGRRCFGMEMEPRYCDCIVSRYIAMAGEDAVSTEIADRYRVEEPANV